VTGYARPTWIGTDRIDFGASPQRPSRGVGDPPSGGASIAAARVTSALAALIEKRAARRSVVTVLAESCSIVGPQQGRKAAAVMTDHDNAPCRFSSAIASLP
jgi:hypothetical protein